MHKHPSKAKDSKSDFSVHVLIKSIASSGLQILEKTTSEPGAQHRNTPSNTIYKAHFILFLFKKEFKQSKHTISLGHPQWSTFTKVSRQKN